MVHMTATLDHDADWAHAFCDLCPWEAEGATVAKVLERGLEHADRDCP